MLVGYDQTWAKYEVKYHRDKWCPNGLSGEAQSYETFPAADFHLKYGPQAKAQINKKKDHELTYRNFAAPNPLHIDS